VGERRVLVCGGRSFGTSARDASDEDRRRTSRERKLLLATLDALNLDPKTDVIIHGGASGADRWASDWAIARGIVFDCYPAKWGRYGKVAGHIRNVEMLHHGKPTEVIAFHGGRGTDDMKTLASAAGIPVTEIECPEE
jgi:hypothetical protein